MPPSSNLVWGIAQIKIICFLQCPSHLRKQQMNWMRITNLVMIFSRPGLLQNTEVEDSWSERKSRYLKGLESRVNLKFVSQLRVSGSYSTPVCAQNKLQKPNIQFHRIKVNHDVGLAGDVKSTAQCFCGQVTVDPQMWYDMMVGYTLHCSYKLVAGYTGYVDSCPLTRLFGLKGGWLDEKSGSRCNVTSGIEDEQWASD